MENMNTEPENSITANDAFVRITIMLLEEIRDLKDQVEVDRWKMKNMMRQMEEMKRAGEEK